MSDRDDWYFDPSDYTPVQYDTLEERFYPVTYSPFDPAPGGTDVFKQEGRSTLHLEGADCTFMQANTQGTFEDIDDVAEAIMGNVMHPAHYARWKMEPIEFIAINNLPWWLANVIKYTMRYDAKDGLQDLYKARSYLEMKIRQLEGVQRFWDKPVTEERKLNDVGQDNSRRAA